MASLLEKLDRFLDRAAPAPGETWVVALSGGTDSLALLAALARRAPSRGLELAAAHLDHGLDPGSSARAEAAARLAARLGVAATVERREVAAMRRSGESPEAAARRVRYRFLEEARRRRGARWVATAHHADDQAETVLLRIAGGTGLPGLAAIAPRRGRIVRPVLGVRRAELVAFLASTGLEPVADPSNLDVAVPRNALRHRLLPHLERAWPEAAGDLARLATTARGARERIEGLLTARLRPRADPRGGLLFDRHGLAALPPPLWPYALGLVARRAGRPYPPTARAAAELARQLERGLEVGCDAGGGWRITGARSEDSACSAAGATAGSTAGGMEGATAGAMEGEPRGGTGGSAGGSSGTLRLAPAPEPAEPFTYTFEVPGEVELTEIGARFHLDRRPVEPWMFRGERSRAALALPIEPGDGVTVRSRLPGDRVQPLGCAHRRRLKEVLIDRRVPRADRGRLPLLVVDRRIAWVPGVTIDEAYRIEGEKRVWVARIEAV